MSDLKNDRLLKALLRQPVDVTPVWMMRQAGRYLPEYCALRKRAGSFLKMCKTPELATEITLQPLQRFPLDAAIIFSDILTIPDAMGLGLYFVEGKGPGFERPIQSASDINKLSVPDIDKHLDYVMATIGMVRQELDGKIPLIGFSGSPWTLATYMVEGKSSKEFAKIKTLLFDHPALLHQLLDVLAQSIIAYLNAQIIAGAQAIMIFDTWGGILTTRDYSEFSLKYMAQILTRLIREHEGRQVPVILFTKGSGAWLEQIADTGCDAVGIDWTIDIGSARERVGARVALQGNMDPCVLYASPDRIRKEVKTILESYGKNNGHVFNLGHGIHPQIDPLHVAAFIDAVHELSTEYHYS